MRICFQAKKYSNLKQYITDPIIKDTMHIEDEQNINDHYRADDSGFQEKASDPGMFPFVLSLTANKRNRRFWCLER